MNFLTALAILGGLFLFINLFFLDSDIEEKDIDTFIKIYSIISTLCLIITIGTDVYSATDKWTSTQTATEYIVALQDESLINGKFYLRSGSINQKDYYKYLVKLKSGGYKANQIPANQTTIYITDNNFRVEWYERERGLGLSNETEKFWYIYIPENAIIYDFNIDLQ